MIKYFYSALVTKYWLFGSSSFTVSGSFDIDNNSDVLEYAKQRVIMDHKSLVNGLSVEITSLNRI